MTALEMALASLERLKTKRYEEAKILLLSLSGEPNICWIWPRAKHRTGYGTLQVYDKNWYVHRLSLYLFKPEEFDASIDVCHICNTRLCYNPDHLYSGTRSDNIYDSVKAGTHVQVRKTHCPRGHEYSEENTYIDRNNARVCRKCKNTDRYLRELSKEH